MESLSDYFALGYAQTLPDFLVLLSFIIFIVGIVSLVLPAIQLKRKSSPYFIAAFILFIAAVGLGWNGILESFIS